MNDELEWAYKRLDDYICSHGIRHSAERRIILEKIVAMDAHFTVASLYEAMQGSDYVSMATVYNTIELFIKVGIIVKHPFTNPEYEFTLRSVGHHHRICRECGSVKEFTDQKINKAIKVRTFSAFNIEYNTLYMYGLCKKCMIKRQKNNSR